MGQLHSHLLQPHHAVDDGVEANHGDGVPPLPVAEGDERALGVGLSLPGGPCQSGYMDRTGA
jgi:hypothetical protein